MDIKNKILVGNSLEVLKTLPDESVDCIMTSPPYWALRNYGEEGQLGLESSLFEYVNKLCEIFKEAMRVLKEAGTCWVNIGDTYAGGGSSSLSYDDMRHLPENCIPRLINTSESSSGFKNKCLLMIPERFAIQMIENGWILRNQIIWYKPNPIPCPVKDRFTVDFEKLFFFVKSKKYNFNQLTSKDSIRNERTVWKIHTSNYRGEHYATYPEELCIKPILAGSPKEGLVLDPFFGSGTTGLVALKNGRNFVGIELNEKYAQLARDRLQPYIEQDKLSNYFD